MLESKEVNAWDGPSAGVEESVALDRPVNPNLKCFKCKHSPLADNDRLLVCDGNLPNGLPCPRGYHISCLSPALDAVPDGDWFCPRCTLAAQGARPPPPRARPPRAPAPIESDAEATESLMGPWKAPLEAFPHFTPEMQISEALRYRQCLEDVAPTNVCCVCECGVEKAEIVALTEDQFMPLAEKLLRKDGPQTPDRPRKGHTVVSVRGTEFCLASRGVMHVGEYYRFQACRSCLADLQRGRIPVRSLVSYDRGRPPSHLPEPTFLELLSIAPVRPAKNFVFIFNKHGGPNGGAATRGQLIGYHNGTAALANMLPLALDEIPKMIKV